LSKATNMSFVVDSFRKGLNAIKSVGGWRAAWDRMLRESYVQFGTLVGVDKYGNKYYENRSYFFSRHRFVWYPYVDRFTFDASQVPAEWHRWLHYITDDPPTTVPPEPRKFIQPHETNKTGTKLEYVPYSTTLPRIEEWVPPKNNWKKKSNCDWLFLRIKNQYFKGYLYFFFDGRQRNNIFFYQIMMFISNLNLKAHPYFWCLCNLLTSAETLGCLIKLCIVPERACKSWEWLVFAYFAICNTWLSQGKPWC